MKKYLFILIVLFSLNSIVSAQSFVLTAENFKDMSNLDNDYIVVNVDGLSKNEAFKRTKSFINTYYNSPKNVTSEVDNEQIVIDAKTSKAIRAIYRFSGGNLWVMEYKIEFLVKDGKILFRPLFKRLDNIEDGSSVGLTNGVFNKKGEVKKKNANEAMNKEINLILSDFTKYMSNSSEKTDW